RVAPPRPPYPPAVCVLPATPTTDTYTLSLHDALPICGTTRRAAKMVVVDADHPDIEAYIDWKVKEEQKVAALVTGSKINQKHLRSEEHTSELQSPCNLVCRLLLEKKKLSSSLLRANAA